MSDIHGQASDLVFAVINYRLDVFGGISLPILDIVFGVFIHYLYKAALGAKHRHISWLQGYFATVVMASGGGCTVALIRGEPLGILKSNEFWVIHSLTYLALFSNDIVFQGIHWLFCSVPFVEHIFTVSDGFLRTMAMVQFGVDGVEGTVGANKWMAQLICGTLAGCGGGLWMDAFRLDEPHWTFGTPRLLRAASTDMKVTLATVVLYMGLVDEWSWVDTYLGFSTTMDHIEAQAWCALFLTAGLIINTKVSYWNKLTPRAVEDKKVGKKMD